MMAKPNPVFFALQIAGPAIILVWLAGVALTALSLVLPVQVGRLTNLFAGSSEQPVRWEPVNRAILYIVSAQLAASLVGFWQGKRIILLRESLTRELAMHLYARIARFSPDYFRQHEIESINIRVLEDSKLVVDFSTQATATVPLASFALLVLGAFMLWENWFLGLCMIPLALLSGYFLLFDRRIQEINRKQRKVWDEIRVRSHEMIAGVGELRNHNAFAFGVQQIGGHFDRYKALMSRLGQWVALFQAGIPLVKTVQNSALYWLGAGLCISGTWMSGLTGQMTWGEVIQFMLLVGLFAEPVHQISFFVMQWRMSRESMRRVAELFDQPVAFLETATVPAHAERSMPRQIDFELIDVSVVTPSGVPILKQINATAPAKTHVALVGTAGCGKSTLLQLLIRGADATEGLVKLSGRDIGQYDMSALADVISFVPQLPIIFDASIRNNVLFSLRRPSLASIEVEEGTVDITPLDGTTSHEALDREIIEVLRRVDFEADLLQKSLESQIPSDRRFESFRALATELRDDVRQRLSAQDGRIMVPFDHADYFTEGTLGENILGIGRSLENWGNPEKRRLQRILSESGLLSDVLNLGFRRVNDEYDLAARISWQSPQLAELLNGGRVVDDGLPLIVNGLADLEDEAQSTLIGLAFELSASLAAGIIDRPTFRGQVVDTRQRLQTSADLPDVSWPDQRRYADHLTLRENILFGRPDRQVYRSKQIADEAIRETLRESGGLESALAAGLRYRVGARGQFLSGGQRQKLALARALIKRPSVLLLDEATASLDEISQARITGMLQRDCRDRTIISASHRLSTIRDFDQIWVLDRGQIVQRGSFDQLTAEDGIFRQLVSQEPGGTLRPVAVPSIPAASAETSTAARDEMLHALASCGLFANLANEQLILLTRSAQIVNCPSGTVLFESDEVRTELFVILDGEVEMFQRQGDGADQLEVVACHGPGQTLNELGLLGATRRMLGARAKTDLQLCLFQQQDLVALIDAEPQIAITMLVSMARRVARLEEQTYAKRLQDSADGSD